MPGNSVILIVIEFCSFVTVSLTSSIVFLYVNISVLSGSRVNDNTLPVLLESDVSKIYEWPSIKDRFGSLTKMSAAPPLLPVVTFATVVVAKFLLTVNLLRVSVLTTM